MVIIFNKYDEKICNIFKLVIDKSFISSKENFLSCECNLLELNDL